MFCPPPFMLTATTIEIVDTVSGTVTAGAATSVTMPTNGANDIVVAWFGQDYLSSDSMPTLAGFTTVIDSNLTDRPRARAAYLVNPGSSATLTNNSAARDLFYILRSYSGVDTASPLTGTASRVSGSSGDPNPPSITPAYDASMVIALGIQQNITDTAGWTAPSGYTTNLTVKSAGESAALNAVGMMADKLLLAAAAENPGTFDNAGTSDQWSAVTLALKPA